MNAILLFISLVFLVGCADPRLALRSRHQDDAAFAAATATQYAQTACADNLRRVQSYVPMDHQASTTYLSDCRIRTEQQHYDALMTALGSAPVLSGGAVSSGYTNPYATSSNSSMYNQANAFGPYGVWGPTWQGFNQQFQAPQHSTVITPVR